MDKNSEIEQRPSLRGIFERIESAENPDWEIFKLSLDNAGRKGAELPEILRACAIPRRFDRRIIGVLRNMPNEEDRNQQVLDMVCTHSFVRKREDGSYVYHDAIRNAVLEDWRLSREKQEQFVEINNRLAEFYEGERARAQRAEQDLILVSSVMRRANIDRYRRLADVVARRVLLPVLEALYHRLLASPSGGFSFFRTQFERHEEDGRLIACKALISKTRDFLLRLPLDQQDLRYTDWLDYFEARTLRQLPPFDFRRAEEKLRGLCARKDIESQLRFWVLHDLAIVQDAQQKLQEVVRTSKELLALAQESGEDVYNWPIYFSNLGRAYWTLGELDHAIEYYRNAIDTSDTNRIARRDTRVIGRVDLSGVYCEAGQWDKAIESGVEALYLARTDFAKSRPIQAAVADRLMYLLSVYDPRSADTTAAECILLNEAIEQSKLAARERYIDALSTGGQTRFAEAQLGTLREETDRSESPVLFRPRLLLREALLYESRGRHEEAIEKYTELLGLSQSGQVDNWTKAAALSNRGRQLTKQGHWEPAEEDLRAALALWESYGHETLIAFIHVLLGDLLRRRGLLSEAQEQLDKAAEVLPVGIRTYEEDFHIIQGDVYASQGNRMEARKHFNKALKISDDRKERRSAAKALQKLSIVAAEEGDWVSAAEFVSRAAQEYNELADLDAYRPSATDEEANKKNAEGIRLFCEGSDIIQACELFRSALEDVPSNFWYQLNLAFANAKRGNWFDASQELEQTLAVAPVPMRTARLYRCWRDCLVEYAKSHYRKGHYGEAVLVIKDALRSVEPFLPVSDLIHLRVRLGDYLWSAGQSDEAKQEYAVGAVQAENLHLEYEQLQSAIRRAFLDAADGQLFTAVSNMKAHLTRISSEKRQSLIDVFAEAADLIESPQHFHGAAELMRDLATAERIIKSGFVEIVNDKLLDLIDRRYRPAIYPLSRSKPRSEYRLQPVATPIALEIDVSLAPTDDARGVRWMLEKGIPDMREKVLRDMGVSIPGVRIRANASNPPGGYFHMLFGAPLYLYMVYEGKRFCPEAAKCRQIGLSGLEAENYGRAGGKGLWLDESQWAKAEAAGLPLWDPYEYMTSHTEAVMRAHLRSFFGVQELRDTLDEWVKGVALPQDQREARQKLIDAAIPDDRAFQRLLQVLQALLRENVPILRLDRILTESVPARKGGKTDVVEVVEQIRMALREDLPGNSDHRALVNIPEELERTLREGVRRQDGKLFFALPPEQVQDFLSEVRSIISKTPETKLALVVSLAEVRPLVSAVLALESPNIPVLARRELAAAEEKEQL